MRRRGRISARNESSEKLNVNDKRRSLVMYSKVVRILGTYIHERLKASRLVAVNYCLDVMIQTDST